MNLLNLKSLTAFHFAGKIYPNCCRKCRMPDRKERTSVLDATFWSSFKVLTRRHPFGKKCLRVLSADCPKAAP